MLSYQHVCLKSVRVNAMILWILKNYLNFKEETNRAF